MKVLVCEAYNCNKEYCEMHYNIDDFAEIKGFRKYDNYIQKSLLDKKK